MNLICLKEESYKQLAYIIIMARKIQLNSRWSKMTDEQRRKQSELTKAWRQKNKERVAFLKNKWKEENLEKHRLMEQKYRDKTKDKRKEYDKERNKLNYTDPMHRIKKNQQRRLTRELLRVNKGRSQRTLKYIGCTLDELRKHIEGLFLPGMTWENYGTFGWHVDHIIPQSSFDFSDEEQIKKCMNYKNLQPLWWRDNLSKGDRENFSSNRQDFRIANPEDVGSNPTEFSNE